MWLLSLAEFFVYDGADFDEIRVETDMWVVTFSRRQPAGPTGAQTLEEPVAVDRGAAIDRVRSAPPGAPSAPSADAVAVRSPLAGVFYRSPSPDAAPYVPDGGAVEEGAIIGLLEVMKTYTTVLAPAAGQVHFAVENGLLVGYDDVIAWIVPAPAGAPAQPRQRVEAQPVR